MRQVAVYGAGGQGSVVAWTIDSFPAVGATRPYEVVCFVDDNVALQGSEAHSRPVMALGLVQKRFPEARIVGSLGSPQARKLTMERAAAHGFEFETIIHPSCVISPTARFGPGTVLMPTCVVAPNAQLGRHVQVGLNCTIGHDSIIGDYSTLMPGVHIAGFVRLGEGVLVGMGAVIINGSPDNPLVIGDYAVVGAGACVTKPVAPGSTVVGVPARPLQR